MAHAELHHTLKRIWEDDLLERRPEAEFLTDFLVARSRAHVNRSAPTSYVLNLDAEWGQGKSFFVRHLRDHLRALGYPAVYVDAWKDDFTGEPFTAVMSAIDEFVQPRLAPKNGKPSQSAIALASVKRNLGRILFAAGIGAVKKGSSYIIGGGTDQIEAILSEHAIGGDTATEVLGVAEEAVTESVDELLDQFAQNQIEQFQKAKASLSDFHDNLSAFLSQFEGEGNTEQLQLPFFILVDELDRCRPTYAVEMLERIKHLFDVPNLVFVLSTNTEQLSHSVKAVYGSGFDSENYLERFFNRTYRLQRPEPYQLVAFLWHQTAIREEAYLWPAGSSALQPFIAEMFVKFGMTIRQLERLFEIFSALTLTWNHSVKMDPIVMLVMIVGFIKKVDARNPAYHKWLQMFVSGHTNWRVRFDTEQQTDVGVSMYVEQRLARSPMSVRSTANSLADAMEQDGRGNAYGQESREQWEDRQRTRMTNRVLSQVAHAEYHVRGQQERSDTEGFIIRYWDLIRRAGRLSEHALEG